MVNYSIFSLKLEEDIDSLLDESCKDLENKDLESAKKRASQATKLIDLEKDKLFANEISVASDDQKVADWYRKCWNLLFAVSHLFLCDLRHAFLNK